MNKYFIIGLMLLCMMVGASAYAVNETIRIDALYTEGGVLTNANATITIELPNGTVDISNQTMNSTSTGVFYYDYLIPIATGTYTATARFFVNGTLQGLSTETFIVGQDRLVFGTCPANQDLAFLWFAIIMCVSIFLLSILFNVQWLDLIGSIFGIFISLYFFPCSFLLGMIVLVTFMAMTVFSLFRKI